MTVSGRSYSTGSALRELLKKGDSMNKNIILIFILIVFCSFSFAQVVNGDTLTVDGKKILKIWGTHYERGYAHGYLLGENIKEIYEEYIIGFFFGNNATLYVSCRDFFIQSFGVENKFHDEAEGMIDGIQNSGISLYSSVLNRDLDEIDILLSNSIVDIAALGEENFTNRFGCSSLSSWGQNTILDPELNGFLIITRNLDWMPHPTLLDNHLLIVQFPSEPDEINWLSFTFAGMFGALSAINENGVAAFLNMGNYNNHPNLNTFHPIFFTIRNGIEANDYNGDSQIDPYDIASAISDKYQLSGSIVHSTDETFGIVVECNNENGVEIRDDSYNTIIPEEHLIATNHFRILYSPVYCNRYANIADSLDANALMNVERSWNLLGGAAGVSHNLHTIEFAPTLNLIKWSTAQTGIPAYQLEPTVFDTQELFTLNVSADPDFQQQFYITSSYPNPFYSSTKISFFTAEDTKDTEISIYNIKGQKIRQYSIFNPSNAGQVFQSSIVWDGTDNNGNPVVSGVYLYKFETKYESECGKLILLK